MGKRILLPFQALCLWQHQDEQMALPFFENEKINRSPSQQQQGREEVSNDSSLLSPCASPIITCSAMLSPPLPATREKQLTQHIPLVLPLLVAPPSFAMWATMWKQHITPLCSPSVAPPSTAMCVCSSAFLNPHFLPPPT